MLGFRAEARTTGVKLGDAELEDARWFSREEIGTGTMLPFTQSIAYRLIEDWHDAGAGRPLAETAPRTQRRR
jgi:NAD+ diphosphatase